MTVLVRVSIAEVGHHSQKQVVEESVYLAYISILEPITERSQDRNPGRAGIWRGATYWLALHD